MRASGFDLTTMSAKTKVFLHSLQLRAIIEKQISTEATGIQKEIKIG